ncbi:hypothetical protein Q8F55_005172 [Vanrija albida]|uniref:Telomeric single stranded DNA binding POT1/Cdc13 domain-containing protein n=1 Tax=Vanrija albida TaxID=181172 RepID=A0ABR3Q1D0_9TREE
MPLPTRDIPLRELGRGATLTEGRLRGRLVYTANTLDRDKRGPCVQFSIGTRLDASSDYVASSTGQNNLEFTIALLLFGDRFADDAATRKQMEADLAVLRETLQSPERTITVDCTGGKVTFHQRSNGMNRIAIEAWGPRTLLVKDTERVFLQLPSPPPKPNAWFHSPSPDNGAASRPLARTNSKEMRPLTELEWPPLEAFAPPRQPQPSHGPAARVATSSKAKAVGPGAFRPFPQPHGGAVTMSSSRLSRNWTADTDPPSTPDPIQSAPSSSIEVLPAAKAPAAAFDRREQLRFARAEEERQERERALQEVQARMAEEAEPSRKRKADAQDLDWEQEIALAEMEESGQFEEPAVPPTPPPLPAEQPAKRPRQELDDAQARKKRLEAQVRADAEAKARKAAEERLAVQHEATRAAEAQVQVLESALNTGTIVYTPIDRLVNGTHANVMGIVVESKEPKDPRTGQGSDWHQTIVITDPSLHTPGREREDFAITLFRKSRHELGGFELGTPVLFRQLKISVYKDKLKGTLFPGAAGPVAGRGQMLDPPLCPIEGERLNLLAEWWRKLDGGAAASRPSHASPALQNTEGATDPNGRQILLLEQVQPRKFFAMQVKLLFVVPNNFHKRWELYVTDGTVSPMETRNFHNVDAKIPPRAVICLTVFDTTDERASLFEPGKYFHFKNLRSKDRAGLELNWSDKLTEKQVVDGWRPQNVIVLPKENEAAQAIEGRIKALQQQQRGELPPPPRREASRPPAPAAPASFPMVVPVELPAPPPFVPDLPPLAPPATTGALVATPNLPQPVPGALEPVTIHVGTTHTSEIDHPLTSLTAAFANRTVPNRYRVRARVVDVRPCGVPTFEQDLAVFYCRKCRHPFKFDHCMSCGDTQHAHATCRWEMVLWLEDPENPGQTWPAVLSDGEAEIMLPALPTVHGGVNEIQRTRTRIKELTTRAYDVLMGAKMSGVRPQYIIDMTLQSHVATCNKLQVLVYSVFGMRAAA